MQKPRDGSKWLPTLSPGAGEKSEALLDLIAGLVSVTMTCPDDVLAGLPSRWTARGKALLVSSRERGNNDPIAQTRVSVGGLSVTQRTSI